MTIASVLLALLTATSQPRERFDRARIARLPRRMVRTVPQDAAGRRAVDPQGISGQDDRYRPGARAQAAIPCRERSDVHRGRRLRTRARSNVRACSPPPSWHDFTRQPPPRHDRRPTPMPTSAIATTTAAPATTKTTSDRRAKARARHNQRSPISRMTIATWPSRPSPIPSPGKPSSGFASSATVRPALARARSSTARPRNRSFSPVRIFSSWKGDRSRSRRLSSRARS